MNRLEIDRQRQDEARMRRIRRSRLVMAGYARVWGRDLNAQAWSKWRHQFTLIDTAFGPVP